MSAAILLPHGEAMLIQLLSCRRHFAQVDAFIGWRHCTHELTRHIDAIAADYLVKIPPVNTNALFIIHRMIFHYMALSHLIRHAASPPSMRFPLSFLSSRHDDGIISVRVPYIFAITTPFANISCLYVYASP